MPKQTLMFGRHLGRKIMNSIPFRQRLWESFPTKTVGKLSDKLCGNSCLNCSKFKFFFYFMNIRLIYIHLGVLAHALGKARPHRRPGRRGAGRRSGLRSYPPLGATRSFSTVAPSPRAISPFPAPSVLVILPFLHILPTLLGVPFREKI